MISALNMSGNILKPKIGDVLVLVCIGLIALVVLMCLHTSGETVQICQNGAVLYEINLSDPNNEGKEFTVQGDYTNLLTVKQGKVYVVQSDCPDQYCKHSAAVSKDGGIICCVPNGMMVRMAKEDGLDVIIQ